MPKTCHQYPSLRRWVELQRSEYATVKKGVESPILTGERIRLLDALGFEWGMEERRKTVAAKRERGEGASSMTHLSRRTSLAVPSSEVDFSSLTPSRSCTPPTSRHCLANHGNGGEKQPPKASMMMIGTAEMHGQHHRVIIISTEERVWQSRTQVLYRLKFPFESERQKKGVGSNGDRL